LQRRRIGVLALGGLPDGLSKDIEAALEPTGARLAAVGVVREPADTSGLASDLELTRFADLDTNGDTVQALGTGVGRQFVVGGTLLERIRSKLLSRASGSFRDLDGVIVVRDAPELTGEQRANAGRLESGLLDGISSTGLAAVGVERTDADPSSIGTFESHDLSSVDNLDQVAGRVALVFALLGAEGSFGEKDTADQLLPDLLAPGPKPPANAGTGGPTRGSGDGPSGQG
ncbi:MAG TPA: copper transporter, partial [Solirubrobacterales bacterium]|nr:copper transporter [Solirubrobacterales bacterium]